MRLSKQYNTTDLAIPAVGQVLDEIHALDPSFWGKVSYCRRWEYAFVLGNIPLLHEGPVRWLDVGPGDSIVPFYLRSKGHMVTVVEEEKYRDAIVNNCLGIKGIQFTPISGLWLPFSNASFDIVTAISVIEHIDDEVPVIREWARVLRPGGYFALTTDIAPVANYSSRLRAGDGTLPWHWYDIPTFQARVIGPLKEEGLEVCGVEDWNLDFGRRLPHTPQIELTIVSLIMQKREA